MDLHLSSGCATSVGGRENQEDYAHGLKAFPNGVFAFLADGMGGHEQGEVASRSTADFFDAAMAQGATLQQAAEIANSGLSKLKAACSLAPGAGCTLTAVQVDYGSCLSYVSVGDSYILYFPAGRGCVQLNSLHTRGEELDAMAARGEISRELAARADKRQALVSAVTGKPFKYIDTGTLPGTLNVGDRILLLSDGFLPLGHKRLQQMLAATPLNIHPQAIAQSVVDAVIAAGAPNQDNVTVVCLQVNDRSTPPVADTPAPVLVPKAPKPSSRVPVVCCMVGILLLVLLAALLFKDEISAFLDKQWGAEPNVIGQPVPQAVDTPAANVEGRQPATAEPARDETAEPTEPVKNVEPVAPVEGQGAEDGGVPVDAGNADTPAAPDSDESTADEAPGEPGAPQDSGVPGLPDSAAVDGGLAPAEGGAANPGEQAKGEADPAASMPPRERLKKIWAGARASSLSCKELAIELWGGDVRAREKHLTDLEHAVAVGTVTKKNFDKYDYMLLYVAMASAPRNADGSLTVAYVRIMTKLINKGIVDPKTGKGVTYSTPETWIEAALFLMQSDSSLKEAQGKVRTIFSNSKCPDSLVRSIVKEKKATEA